MSSFNCPKCGTAIIDTPKGYVTSCEHYQIENLNNLAEFSSNKENINGKD